MEDQDKRVEEQPGGDGREENATREEETQVGQVVRDLAKTTRPLPTVPPPRRAAAQAANAVQRERIATFIIALGDPTHPLHHQALDELVTIGAPAVPALNEALNPHRPWLTAYRAAEALGQIGDGRAAGPLLDALRHPNSNVRWGAVRALAVVGDARALLELRRVARDDHSKTSWGESVAGAAQSVLGQMQSHNMILRGADLIKTSLACVVMLISLTLAWSVITNLRAELREIGNGPVEPGVVGPFQPTAVPSAESSDPQTEATAEPAVEPTIAATTTISGTVLTTGNVRAQPSIRGDRIGGISEGDEVIFVAVAPDRRWYRIKLGERHASGSRIDSSDESGWVSSTLVSPPAGDVAVEQLVQDAPSPTAAP